MLQQPEKMDISRLVDYRRRLGRGALAGVIYGVIVLFGGASTAFQAGDWGKGILWIAAGFAVVGLARLLRRGFLVAAAALGPSFVLGMFLMWKWIADNWPRRPWNNWMLSILAVALVFGPIAYFLISGIEAVYTSKQIRFGEISELPGTESFASVHFLNRRPGVMRSGKNWRAFALQRCSEVMVLTGAAMMLANALLSALSDFGNGLLSLFGVVLLILGVNLSLHVEQMAKTQMHDLLTRDDKPDVLLLQPVGDDLLKVRAKFTLSRPLINSFPILSFTQLIREQAAHLGKVVAVDEGEHIVTAQVSKAYLPQLNNLKVRSEQQWQAASVGKEPGAAAEMIWRRKLDRWMRTSRVVVMILGNIECLNRERSQSAKQLLQQDAILVFPPVCFRQMKSRWESFCGQFNDVIEPSLISGPDLKRAILMVFRSSGNPLLILSPSRDEWAYQTAFEIAADSLRRQA